MQESIVFLLRVQCRRKESSRSLSHLLMSFLFRNVNVRHKIEIRFMGDAVWKIVLTPSVYSEVESFHLLQTKNKSSNFQDKYPNPDQAQNVVNCFPSLPKDFIKIHIQFSE